VRSKKKCPNNRYKSYKKIILGCIGTPDLKELFPLYGKVNMTTGT
jgi:hypothetical protein